MHPNKTNMLRIYFDWNCITHLKDPENKKLFDYIMSNKTFIIFPFSPAHFEDLQRSRPCRDIDNKDYYKDLAILQYICDNHLIMFDNDKKRVLPFAATPYEYIEKAGDTDTWDDIFRYNTFSEYIKKEVGEPYNIMINELTGKIPVGISVPFFSKEKIEDGLDLLNQGFKYMKKVQTHVNYNRELSAGIKSFDEASFKHISGATSDNIHDEIDKMISKSAPQFNMDKLIELTLKRNKQNSDLTKFISYYLAYDFMGFKQDKGHDLRNTSTDAKHAYYGSYCDILVTNDKRMIEKTKAVYKDMFISTKVISINELERCIEEEKKIQFSLKPYIMELGCNVHFKTAYLQDEIHCKYSYFQSPFLGFFNYGMVVYNIESRLPSFIFQRKLMRNDMVFYSEIDKLTELLRTAFTFDSESVEYLIGVCDKIKKQKKDAVFSVRSNRWIFTFTGDSEFFGMPLLAITHTNI